MEIDTVFTIAQIIGIVATFLVHELWLIASINFILGLLLGRYIWK